MRRAWIVADAHGGASPEADRDLLRLLDRALELEVELWFLGDLFLVWLGPKRYWTSFQAEVMARVHRHRERGLGAQLVVGNREFLVGALEGRYFDRVFEKPPICLLGGVPTLLAHGDLVNGDDRKYRAWHRITRNRLSQAAMASIPPRVAVGLAQRLERAMHRPAPKEGYTLPRAALAALGVEAKGLGAARVVLGHFHQDQLLDSPQGVPIHLAPPWLEDRRILASDGSGGLRSLSPWDVDSG